MSNGEFCIDVVQEWVRDQNFLTTGFINRGDPPAFDFVLANFTRDAAWHDLDLSGIVPAGAKGVSISLYLAAFTINESFHLRMAGNINTINTAPVRTQVAGIVITNILTCLLSNDRHVEYFFTVAVWTDCNFVVNGWWF